MRAAVRSRTSSYWSRVRVRPRLVVAERQAAASGQPSHEPQRASRLESLEFRPWFVFPVATRFLWWCHMITTVLNCISAPSQNRTSAVNASGSQPSPVTRHCPTADSATQSGSSAGGVRRSDDGSGACESPANSRMSSGCDGAANASSCESPPRGT